MMIEIKKSEKGFEVHLEYDEDKFPIIGSVGRGKTISEALVSLAMEVASVEITTFQIKPAATGSGN